MKKKKQLQLVPDGVVLTTRNETTAKIFIKAGNANKPAVWLGEKWAVRQINSETSRSDLQGVHGSVDTSVTVYTVELLSWQ